MSNQDEIEAGLAGVSALGGAAFSSIENIADEEIASYTTPTVMNENTLDSSVIKRAEFKNGSIYILFPSGQTYAYSGVPQSLWAEFVEETGSKGQFFNRRIKNSFPAKKQ